MNECKDCGRVWYSQADWCIYCDSKNIIFDYEEQKKEKGK